MSKYSPVLHAIPFWELDRGGGPVTDVLRMHEQSKQRAREQKLIVDQPAPAWRPGEGNRWVSAGAPRV